MKHHYWIPLSLGALWACSVAAQEPVQPDISVLTIERVESLLAARNRDIALARRALEQAQADVTIAGQRPNPQLGWVTQNINRGRGVGAGGLRDKTVDSIISVSQTFERGNKPELRVATAQQLAAAASDELSDTARVQLLNLRSSYYELLAMQERAASMQESAELFRQTLNAAQLRQKAGDLAGADVARIAVEATRAGNDAGAALSELARARLALAALIAVESAATRIRAVSGWPTNVPSADSTEVQDAVNRRPDVKAAAARLVAAEKARDLAEALRTRDVTVSLQFEHFPVSEANQTGSGNSIGFGIAVPLFLRHQYEGEMARAQADWYAARDMLERSRALATADILRARSDLAAAAERVRRVDGDLLPMAAKSAQAAEFAFRNGASSVMDLLDARRVLKAIQLEAISARLDLAKSLAAWRSGMDMPPSGDKDAVASARRE